MRKLLLMLVAMSATTSAALAQGTGVVFVPDAAHIAWNPSRRGRALPARSEWH